MRAAREAGGGREVYAFSLPAVVTVKEGLNLPRYPSLPGRLKAKKKPLERIPSAVAGQHAGKGASQAAERVGAPGGGARPWSGGRQPRR